MEEKRTWFQLTVALVKLYTVGKVQLSEQCRVWMSSSTVFDGISILSARKAYTFYEVYTLYFGMG